jgi:hypothetical protein
MVLTDASGNGSRRFFPARKGIPDVAATTIVGLWQRFYGSCVLERLGETCRSTSAIGLPSGSASAAGRSKGGFEKVFKTISGEPDMVYALIDVTIAKVHRYGVGAKGGLKIRPPADRVAA